MLVQVNDWNGHYDIRNELGRGASGTVYEAVDLSSGEPVALKVLHGDSPGEWQEFKTEFRALSGLVHPNLVQLFALHMDGADLYFTMELVQGKNLTEHLALADSAERELCVLLPQLIGGIAALHQMGIQHGDIKPANIVVTAQGELKLMDYGLARHHRETHNQYSGTWNYAAPEVAEGLYLEESDWYSLGVILYEALSGQLPVEGLAADSYQLKKSASFQPLVAPANALNATMYAMANALLQGQPEDRKPGIWLLDDFTAPTQVGQLLPSRQLRSGAAHFVGRTDELGQLEEAFDDCMASSSVRMMCITGDSGVGKSALAQEFAQSLQASSMSFNLRGMAHLREFVPFNLLDEMIDDLIKHLELRPCTLPAHIDSAIRMFPSLLSVVPKENPSPALAAAGAVPMRSGAEAIALLLKSLAKIRPLVFILEDVQWADRDSLVILRMLLEALQHEPVFVVLTARPREGEHSAEPPIRDKWINENASLLNLQPLNADDAVILAKRLAHDQGLENEELLAHRVSMLAEGSPYFIGEAVRSFAASDQQEEQWYAGSVRRMTRFRIEQRTAAEQRLLKLCAVAASPMQPRVLIAAAGLNSQDQSMIRELEDTGLLMHSGTDTITVYHNRISQAVLEDLEGSEKGELHLALANALTADENADPGSVAVHCFNAGLPDRAAPYALQAAREAADNLAFEVASSFYRNALAWGWDERNEDRAELIALLGDALFNAGHAAEAAEEFLQASEIVRGKRKSELQVKAAEGYLLSGQIEEGLRLSEILLADLGFRYPKNDNHSLFPLLLEILRLRFGKYKTGKSDATDEIISDTFFSLSRGLVHIRPLSAMEFLVKSLRFASRANDTLRIARLQAFVAGSPLASIPGIRSQALLYLDNADAVSHSLADPYLSAIAEVFRGYHELSLGNWETAVTRAERGLLQLQEQCVGSSWEQLLAHEIITFTLHVQGRYAEAREQGIYWRDEMERLGNQYGKIRNTNHFIYTDLALGELESARRHISYVRTNWTQLGIVQHFYCSVYEIYADLLDDDHLTAIERFLVLYRAFEDSPVGKRVSASRIDMYLLGARTIGSTCRDDLDVPDFGEFARRLVEEERADAPPHGHLFLAGEAARKGDSDEAMHHLSICQPLFQSLNMRLFSSLALRQQCQLSGDIAGVEHFDEEMRKLGVAAPASWIQVYAPGFSD